MIRRAFWILPALLLVPALAAAGSEGMARTHLEHVTKSWKDTPGKVGLVQILEQEADVAAQHARFAASDTSDLGNMKLHVPHVMHAIDPDTVDGGPGKGYGVLKAAKGVAAHMGFARKSEGATGALKTHSQHVIASAQSIVNWSQEIVSLARGVQDADSASGAADKVKRIQALTDRILNGHDANGDGSVSWQTGEGGLKQLKTHLGFAKG